MELVSVPDGVGYVLAVFEVRPGAPSPRATSVSFAAGPSEPIVEAILARLAGHRVGVLDRGDIAAGLLRRGGVGARHSVLMSLDLTAEPRWSGVEGPVSIGPMAPIKAAEYGALMTKAYPPNHPDHEPGDALPGGATATIESYLRGEPVGPWIAEASLEATDSDGRAVGAIVISEMAADRPFPGGPWVTDVFVDPRLAGSGIGGALVGRAAERLRSNGRASLGLSVTAGNPAQRLYARLGFVSCHEIWQVVLPG